MIWRLIFTVLFVLARPAAFSLGFSEETFQKAKAEDKLIFLFIGSDVDLETRDFLQAVSRDDEYLKLFRDEMIIGLLDYDLNPSLAVRYSLPTIPGFFVLDWEGRIYLGATKPNRDEALPVLKQLVFNWKNAREQLRQELNDFQGRQSESRLNFENVQSILDATMNHPNHLSLDLGRYILSLPRDHPWFKDYVDQFLLWVRSENYDFVEGSFFMPRGFSTWFAESKYTFFNFKLLEMLLDFYYQTRQPEFLLAFLKSMRYIHRDLELEKASAYSTGYASKRYFKMEFRERLQHFPPSPRRFDLAISQILFLKILYKIQLLVDRELMREEDLDFLGEEADPKQRMARFARLIERYRREDGLIYFTTERKFTNFETQIEFFALLQLMQSVEKTDNRKFFEQMETLFTAFVKAFYDPEKELFCDAPLKTIAENPMMYQYPLYFVREHARLMQFLDFLADETKNGSYLEWKIRILPRIEEHNLRYPQRFYWLQWYENLLKRKELREQQQKGN